jgi:hypothetical protein
MKCAYGNLSNRCARAETRLFLIAAARAKETGFHGTIAGVNRFMRSLPPVARVRDGGSCHQRNSLR